MTGACSEKETEAPLSIVWEMGASDSESGYYENTFYITNTGKDKLDENWIVYFCQLPAPPEIDENSPFWVEEISSTYYRFYPSDKYEPIPAGETIPFIFRCQGNILKETNAPEGAYFVRLNKDGKETGKPLNVTIEVMPFSLEYQYASDKIYEQNSFFQKKVDLKSTDIFPSIKFINQKEGYFKLKKNISIQADSIFKDEAGFLAEKLQALFGCLIDKEHSPSVFLKTIADTNKIDNDEYYKIQIAENKIIIESSHPHGMFNGIQSLLAIIGNSGNVPCRLECMQICDYPDLSHRGWMLDVARNFTTKTNLLKLIDLLSSYKINVLHLHLSDDEGWRLEIPGLEELTQVGARRGHTLDEQNCLYPAYGGGWDDSDTKNIGNGYYTCSDFIEILEYAHRRHIRVIPEFDLPGHARAAIKAMEVRYNKYKDNDLAKAEEFLLSDKLDVSRYSSAQLYNDNVINVAMPSTYRFVDKIIDSVDSLYKKAGLTLSILHLGGDEVPHGTWEGSFVCKKWMKEQGMTEIRELKDYFVRQALSRLNKKGIQLAAWQEVALLPDHKTVNQQFTESRILSYCWDTKNEDEIPYLLANAGYPVILCNVTNLYFDLAYNMHPKEPGLYWGGTVNEYLSFSLLPFDIYKSIRFDRNGNLIDIQTIQQNSNGKLPLEPEAHAQIKGIQGQIWAETIRSYDMIERALFPKLFGLAERAWNVQPEWAETSDENAYQKALIEYNAKITTYEFPRLLKYSVNFRIAPPGIACINGQLYMNSTIQDASIYYTTNGNEPTENDYLWKAPVECDAANVKAKTYYHGKESVTTVYVR
jgi:hexosaminidase